MKRFLSFLFAVPCLCLCACAAVLPQEGPELETTRSEDADPAETGTDPVTDATETETETDGNEETEDEMTLVLTVGSEEFTFRTANTAAAEELLRRLPLTLRMQELNGNEKYCYLDTPFPADARQVGVIEAGDVMLYGDSCVVVFYESFETPYSYTPLGRLDFPHGLAEALGSGGVDVTLSVKE